MLVRYSFPTFVAKIWPFSHQHQSETVPTFSQCSTKVKVSQSKRWAKRPFYALKKTNICDINNCDITNQFWFILKINIRTMSLIKGGNITLNFIHVAIFLQYCYLYISYILMLTRSLHPTFMIGVILVLWYWDTNLLPSGHTKLVKQYYYLQ
jgi:hypothetical protein